MSDSVRPHRRQPTRPHRPWDSPGKNTGVGCHFLLQRMKVKSESEVAQSCPTLSDPMDCSLPGSSIHGIFQARVLEWGALGDHYQCQLSFLSRIKYQFHGLLSLVWKRQQEILNNRIKIKGDWLVDQLGNNIKLWNKTWAWVPGRVLGLKPAKLGFKCLFQPCVSSSLRCLLSKMQILLLLKIVTGLR